MPAVELFNSNGGFRLRRPDGIHSQPCRIHTPIPGAKLTSSAAGANRNDQADLDAVAKAKGLTDFPRHTSSRVRRI